MNGTSWIVCERGGRWTPALRLALEREAPTGRRWRIIEVRHLAEWMAELAACPKAVAAVEVGRENLAEALDGLAAAARQFPAAICVALVDRELASRSRDYELWNALREAGASDVTDSPRCLESIIALGRRHALALDSPFAAGGTLVEQLWATLPWQDA